MAELLDVSTEPVIEAQTQAPESEPSKWMPLSDEQRASAPEDIKALLEAKKWNSLDDALKGYKELEKFVGVGKHIVIPTDDDPAKWNDVWNQLGRPETSDKYVLNIESDAIEPELAEKWKKFAHTEGYTQKQMEGAVQFQLDIISSINKAENDAKEQTKQDLIKKWGGEQAYKNNTIEARMVADQLGIYKKLEAKGLASDPDIIEMLIDLKNKTAEGVITPPAPPEPGKDPLTEMAEIKASEAFTKRFHPQHKEVMKRFMELNMEIANRGLAPKRIQGG